MRKVPDIVRRTGVSQDYWTEIFQKKALFDLEGPGFVVDHTRTRPVRTYEQRLSPDQYADVVNDKNRNRIEKLDNLAKLANRVLSKPETAHYINNVAKAAYYVIYGQVAVFL